MESVKIDVDPEKEELVPRPDPGDELLAETADILTKAEPLLDQYSDVKASDLIAALEGTEAAEPIEADTEDDDEFDFGQFVPKAGTEDEEE
jgi:flagellar protein FlaI